MKHGKWISAAAALVLAVVFYRVYNEMRASEIFRNAVAAYAVSDVAGAERLLLASGNYSKKRKIGEFLYKVQMETAMARLSGGMTAEGSMALERAKMTASEYGLTGELEAAVKRIKLAGGDKSRVNRVMPVDVLLGQSAGQSAGGVEGMILRLVKEVEENKAGISSELSKLRTELLGAVASGSADTGRMFFWNSAIFFILFLSVFALLIWIFSRFLFRREKMFMEAVHLLSHESPSGRKFLMEEKPELAQISVIEAELVSPSDAHAAQGLLNHFMEDSDPLVRANAAKALNKYNSEASYKVLRTMADSGDLAQVCACLSVLGEMVTPEAAEIVGMLAKKNDETVQRLALKQAIKMKKSQLLSVEASAMLSRLIEEARAKTGWVL